ncbi:MAG: hypothetical protein EHM81_06825 [Chloroflexi bacterium]|nr:MAG: hypothetical protein EHM81_06825 [Chloroflexota bacterium]
MKTFLQNDSPDFRANLTTGFVVGAMLGVALGMGFGSILLGLAVGMALGLALGIFISRRELPMRYPMYLVRRMLLTGTLFLLTMMIFALAEGMASGATLILGAMVPTLAGALFVYSIGSAIASLDEMQRRIQTEAIAIGFGGTAIALIPLALLDISTHSPSHWLILSLIMVSMWLVGKLWTKRRYG